MSDFIHREADYAVRIVTYLAGEGRKIKIAEVCESLHLGKPIVVKIVQQLKRCGILATKTGKYGGLTLTADMDELSIYDILACMGFTGRMNVCVGHEDACQLKPICNITDFLAGLQEHVIRELKAAKIKNFIFRSSTAGS